MKFPKKELQELASYGDVEGYEVIYDNVIDNSRWSINHEMVFKFENKFYQTTYSVGATESQDECPYEYENDEIECVQVAPVEKVITVYEPV